MSILPAVSRRSLLRLSHLRQPALHRSLRPAPSVSSTFLSRSYSFVPPQQLESARQEQDEFEDEDYVLPPPESPTFYTTRPEYYDHILQLERGVGQVQAALKNLHLIPLPHFIRKTLPPKPRNYWKNKEDMGAQLGIKLPITNYNRITSLLNKLMEYHQIATVAGVDPLANSILAVTKLFNSSNAALYANRTRKKVTLDQYGRSFTVGRRKTSAARVWMITVREEQAPPPPPDSPEAMLGLEPTSSHNPPVSTSTILVNNVPLNEYFVNSAERERIIYPFKVAGMLGKYNVFALTRGGGTTGQSGALAVGIAKGLVAHDPGLDKIFRRLKLSWRDPRMVERKKTNRPKARKGYTWVKR